MYLKILLLLKKEKMSGTYLDDTVTREKRIAEIEANAIATAETKASLLMGLRLLEGTGKIVLSKPYSMKSDIKEMEIEYRIQSDILDRKLKEEKKNLDKEKEQDIVTQPPVYDLRNPISKQIDATSPWEIVEKKDRELDAPLASQLEPEPRPATQPEHQQEQIPMHPHYQIIKFVEDEIKKAKETGLTSITIYVVLENDGKRVGVHSSLHYPIDYSKAIYFDSDYKYIREVIFDRFWSEYIVFDFRRLETGIVIDWRPKTSKSNYENKRELFNSLISICAYYTGAFGSVRCLSQVAEMDRKKFECDLIELCYGVQYKPLEQILEISKIDFGRAINMFVENAHFIKSLLYGGIDME
jgi:hypothetical protein